MRRGILFVLAAVLAVPFLIHAGTVCHDEYMFHQMIRREKEQKK